jgi:hypothetical protein
MMPDGVGISFLEAGDLFVFRQKFAETFFCEFLDVLRCQFLEVLLGQNPAEVLLGYNPAELVVIEHGHFAFTTPAPQHPHGSYLNA